MPVEQWDGLPWWQHQMYVEGFWEDNLIGDGTSDSSSDSPAGAGAVDLATADSLPGGLGSAGAG